MKLPRTWATHSLGDLVTDIQSGFAQRPNPDDKGIPQLRTNNVSPQGRIDLTSLAYVEVNSAELEKYVVQRGDVIFNNTNSSEWVGKTSHFDLDGTFVISNHMTRMRVRENILDAEYLSYYLHYLWSIGLFRRTAKRWVNQAAIDQSELARLEVTLPTLREQHRIVSLFSQTNVLRDVRRHANSTATQLVPSLFFDMFGDPGANPRGWPTTRIEDVLSEERAGIRTGPFGSALKRSEYVEEGIPVWGINNIQDNRFTEDGALYITPDKYQQLKEYRVEPRDVLISRAGTVGRMAVAHPSKQPSIIGTNLIRVVLNVSRITPEYFVALFTFFHNRIGRLRASGDEESYSFLNPKDLKRLRIPEPDIELQHEFARRTLHIEALQAQQKLTESRLDNLLQSLANQAFTGELTRAWREQHIHELEAEALRREVLLSEPRPDIESDIIKQPDHTRPARAIRIQLEKDQIVNQLLGAIEARSAYFLPEDLLQKGDSSESSSNGTLTLVDAEEGLRALAALGFVRLVQVQGQMAYRRATEQDIAPVESYEP